MLPGRLHRIGQELCSGVAEVLGDPCAVGHLESDSHRPRNASSHLDLVDRSGLPLVLTAGGPGTATETLMTEFLISPTFGQPASFIDPRRAMLSVRLNLGR